MMPTSTGQKMKCCMNDVDGHIKGDAVVVAGRMNLIDLKDRVAEIAKEGFIDVRVKALKVLVTFDLHETLTSTM